MVMEQEGRRSYQGSPFPGYADVKSRTSEKYRDMVHVHVRTCSEPLDKSAATVKQLSATREACRKITSLFPSFWGGIRDHKRAARQQANTVSGDIESRRPSNADSLESSCSAVALETSFAEPVRSASHKAGSGGSTPEEAVPTCATPPHAGRIRYSYRKRPKELRTVGGPLRDAEPNLDFSLLQEDTDEVSPVHAAVAHLLNSLQTHTVESWESMLPHCQEAPEVSATSALFYGKCPPPISVTDYILRIQKYSHCTPACFLHAVVYMDRLVDKYGVIFAPNTLNVHRILLTGVVVAAKFLDDRVFSNAYYARIGGVTTQELNGMEREFLKLMSYKLRVKPALVESYCKALERSLGKQVVPPVGSLAGDTMASDALM